MGLASGIATGWWMAAAATTLGFAPPAPVARVVGDLCAAASWSVEDAVAWRG